MQPSFGSLNFLIQDSVDDPRFSPSGWYGMPRQTSNSEVKLGREHAAATRNMYPIRLAGIERVSSR
jgi:hypothetical protein